MGDARGRQAFYGGAWLDGIVERYGMRADRAL